LCISLRRHSHKSAQHGRPKQRFASTLKNFDRRSIDSKHFVLDVAPLQKGFFDLRWKVCLSSKLQVD
jgi:hypothetical protein